MTGLGRFAPSTTGPAHPGTLLAALLCWLDARSRGIPVLLRLEDLDPERCRPEHARAMQEDLTWFGLDWDAVELQSDHGVRHAAALDGLADQGLLYPCTASRAELAAGGRRAPDGAWAYDNRHRGTPLPAGGWRAVTLPLRLDLGRLESAPVDEGGLDLAGNPGALFGDPVVRRRDGAVAYQLAVVVDDAARGVTRVVRGRDIAPSTMIQVAIQRRLGLPTPVYRHHSLLLEPGTGGRKHSKFHGAVGVPDLRREYSPERLCGVLARFAGLVNQEVDVAPKDLLSGFTWDRVRRDDPLVAWDGRRLAEVTP